jgi:hypothetical protein
MRQPRPAARRARTGRRDALDRLADVRLEVCELLGQVGPLEAGDDAPVGEVHLSVLELDLVAVEQLPPLLVGVVTQLLARVEEAGVGVDRPRPRVDRVAREADRVLVEAAVPVEQRVDVDAARATQPLALRAHALGVVEPERRRRVNRGLSQPRVEDPEQGCGIGRRPDGGPGVAAHPGLVDHDRRRQVVDGVDVGPPVVRQEVLHEGRVRLVDQSLRLGRDRVEDQRRLARAGHPGDHRERPFRDVQRHVAQVVLPGAPDLDRAVQGMPVGHVHLHLSHSAVMVDDGSDTDN